MDRPTDLGRRLRAAREYKGLSQAALADAVTGVSQSAVARYEKGELPDDRKLAALLHDWAEVCELPLDWFTVPWGQPPAGAAHPDEPEWVGRLEGQIKLILDVLRAEAQAETAMEQIADGDADPRSSTSRRPRRGRRA